MLRPGVRRLFTAALLGAFALSLATVGDAEAGKKKKRKKKAAPAAAALKLTTGEHAKALSELMGPYKFGTSSKDILAVLGKQINEKYAEKIKATTDVYAQDKLRRNRQAELARIKKSLVEFKGLKGGWDVSIIDDQFAHNTDESMMVHWENSNGSDQRRFFFFRDGRLYKMFIALNTSTLKDDQRNFAFFKGLMEARYGGGKVINSKDIDGVVRPTGLEWRTKSHHVSALDKLNFYGSFCLVIADPEQEQQLLAVRAASAKPPKSSAAMKSVMNVDGDDTPGLDDNKAAVDAVLKGN